MPALPVTVRCRILQDHNTAPESAVAEDRAKRRRRPILVSEDDDRVDLTPLELAATAQIGQLQQHADGLHRGAGLLNEGDGGSGRPTGGQHVVDDQDPRTLGDGLGPQLHPSRAVLECVVHADDRAGQLAALAHRNHADPEPNRQGRRQDEAARLEPRDRIDPTPVVIGQPLDESGEGLTISQERSDVPEEDPRLGEVGNLSQVAHDQPGQRLGHRLGMGHGSGHLRFFFLFG